MIYQIILSGESNIEGLQLALVRKIAHLVTSIFQKKLRGEEDKYQEVHIYITHEITHDINSCLSFIS